MEMKKSSRVMYKHAWGFLRGGDFVWCESYKLWEIVLAVLCKDVIINLYDYNLVENMREEQKRIWRTLRNYLSRQI